MRKVVIFMVCLAFSLPLFANGEGETGSEAKRWQDDYPVLVISAVSSENEADKLARYQNLQDYLSEQLGVKVEFFSATDYAGTIEAMAAKKVHIGRFGTASYSRAWRVTEGGVRAILCELNNDGSSGYHSTIWVKEDSPYQSLEDLEGKSLAFADPNSTSGFLVPTYYLTTAENMPPKSYFSETGFAGNHEGVILSIIDGKYDAGCNWYTNSTRSNVQRMIDKGMIEEGQVRMIWKSPLITNGPWAVLDDLPQELVDDFTKAMLEWEKNDPESIKEYFAPNDPTAWMEVDHDRYNGFIEMQIWVDENS